MSQQQPNRVTRSSNSSASSSSALPPRQRVPAIVRQIRDPVCTDFGPDWETLYNGYHFCSNCKAFELAKITRPKLNREKIKKFTCEAGHKSFDHPTVKRKH